MLRVVSIAVASVLLLSSSAFARSVPSEMSLAHSFPVPPVLARAAVVLDASNGAMLGAVNPYLRLPIASTTKIMTAVVALQSGQLTDRIVVPRSAFDYEADATVMGLHAGQTVTLRDLLYGLMLPSGADAANTIAIHYGGSEARFAGMMNREAAMLGMRDTHYANAHGLTAKNHYSSAYDLAVLAQYAAHVPEIMKIAATRSYSWGGHVLTNLNHVLFWYAGVDGIKPGYTDEAGICQVLDARRDGRHVVVVLLHTPNLVTDARNLLNFGLRDFAWQQSSLPGDAPSIVQSGIDAHGSYIYYSASGHFVRGKLLVAYAGYGGSQALGFPRTEPLANGKAQVQFFQNGALSLDASTGRVTRLQVGLTPLPEPTPISRTPTPTPVAYRTATSTPVSRRTVTATPVASTPSEATVTPRSVKTVTQSRASLTRRGAASNVMLSNAGATATPSVAGSFAAFHKAHHALLGSAAAPVRVIHGYPVQIFAYGALIRDVKHNSVMLLPIADRLLWARHYLPAHPGNRYPFAFAPDSVLQAIDWLPKTASSAPARKR